MKYWLLLEQTSLYRKLRAKRNRAERKTNTLNSENRILTQGQIRDQRVKEVDESS